LTFDVRPRRTDVLDDFHKRVSMRQSASVARIYTSLVPEKNKHVCRIYTADGGRAGYLWLQGVNC